MSEATTGLFNTAPVFPRLVLDETLKRARVETSEGTAVRVTSSTTDLAPITDALGTQQDPVDAPTVIGLLKNLITQGGGGGGDGGSTTLQVPRIQLYDTLTIGGGYDGGRSWFSSLQITFDLNGEPIASFPDWADYIGFYSLQNGNFGVCKLKNNGSNKIIILELRAQGNPDETMAGGPSMQLIKDYTKIELDEIFNIPRVPLTMTCYGWQEDWSSGSPTVRNYSDRDYVSFIPFVFSLSSFDISGGGGGGSGDEAISTYSFTLNNVNTTAITAPVSNPPSNNDKTLVSLGYLKNLINNAHLQRRQLLLTGQITVLDTGTSYNLENTFNITIPSWANRLRLGCQFGYYGETQGYVEFGLVAGNYTYTALNGSSNSFFAANFNYSNKVLTVNKCMRLQDSDNTWDPTTTKFAIISITAYGNFSF